jgi:hypothetical protein
MMSLRAFVIILWAGFFSQSWATVLPEQGVDKHLGVASCSNGVCHGKVNPEKNSTIWQNEYRVWLKEDYHSRAYRTLQTKQSKDIAAKLGLASADTAKICLDCHADNVSSHLQGEKFQLSDGVGCEACHGGSERWIKSHAEKGIKHADNVALGLYPTEEPVARAKLCLSCHLGTKDKFATHEIMGAGHPRLVFELETFTANQPAHYSIDADYNRRKGVVDSANVWLAGLIYSSRQSLMLISQRGFSNAGLFPELALFECDSCHHPMSDLRWQPEMVNHGNPPGAVRLNDASLEILINALEVLAPNNALILQRGLTQLHQSSLKGSDALLLQAASLSNRLELLTKDVATRSYTSSQLKDLRKQLLLRSAQNYYRDFTSAEQVFLAVEALTISLGQELLFESELDKLYAAMSNENNFVAKSFAVLAKQFLTNLQ